ncbi:MAG: GNAT family N-acetyltransferase [Sphingorhabdus sp.]
MEVRIATVDDLDALVPLFDDYRQFYKFPSDRAGGQSFLQARFDDKDSVIFIAIADGEAVGFMQLYPSYSSARMARVFILNDLFVTPDTRRCGAGRALLVAARTYGETNGAVRLTLSTATDNHMAQSLYEAMGWMRDTVFYAYNLALNT